MIFPYHTLLLLSKKSSTKLYKIINSSVFPPINPTLILIFIFNFVLWCHRRTARVLPTAKIERNQDRLRSAREVEMPGVHRVAQVDPVARAEAGGQQIDTAARRKSANSMKDILQEERTRVFQKEPSCLSPTSTPRLAAHISSFRKKNWKGTWEVSLSPLARSRKSS